MDSTNTEAFRRAEAGDGGPLWIMARQQTQGRGRSGRSWMSPAGNFYASLLQRLDCSHSVVHQLSLLAGVAVVDAITAAAGAEIHGMRLKWPNDVLIADAKCAGILPESHSIGRSGEIVAVIGIGINLAWHPDDLGRAATHLAAHGVSVAPEAMLEHVAEAMQHWLTAWDGGKGFALVRTAWLERGGPVGETFRVDTGRERIEGTFLDLGADGALIMRDGHGLQRQLTYGEVTIGSPASEKSTNAG